MKTVKCQTQAELDKAIADNSGDDIWLVGIGSFEISGSSQVTAYGSSQVRAYGSSQVTAYGSSQVRAYGSSQVTAYDSSQVTAYDSSQVRAYDSSQVTACGSSQVTACDYVAVTKPAKSNAKVIGGVVILLPPLDTAAKWCEFYGLEINDGIVVLFKALNDDFTSPHKTSYAPGSAPTASDWDGGKEECGFGLHFSPRPFMALEFHKAAKKFAGCPVKVSEIVVHPDGQYPEKVKAPGCCGPCFEVDLDGNPIGVVAAVAEQPLPAPEPTALSI